MDGLDELARIGAAFDEMAERLSTTLVSKQELEATVARRTTQLSGALAEGVRTQAALAEREERLRLLLDSTAEAIYGLDPTGACTFCNPACVRLLGYASPRDLVGRNMHDLVHHSRRDGTPAPAEACGIFRTLRNGEGHHASDDVLWRADGTALEVEWWSYPILRGAARVGAVVTFLDVGERKKLEGELLNMRKLESVALLAGGIAHDFNNLLTGILGNVSLASECLPAGGEVAELLEEAEAATLRAKALTRQLLTFSRGGAPVKKGIPLRDVVHEAARFALSGSAVGAEYTSPARPVAGRGRRGPDRSGGPEPGHQRRPGDARGRQGAGLDRERRAARGGRRAPPARPLRRRCPSRTRARASPPSTCRGSSTRTSPPSARGAASGSRPSTRSCGTTAATSRSRPRRGAGRASTSTSRPPRAPAAEPAPAPARPAGGGGGCSSWTTTPRCGASAGAMLARLGYEVVTVADGDEAIAAFGDARRAGRPMDVVVMDLTVPGGMGGAEALRALRAIDPAVRAVVTSGYSNDPVMSRYREHGFSGIVTKPYTVDELAAAVAEAIAAPPPPS